MANYSKRDTRKKWVEDMAAHRGPSCDERLRCHCGELAVIAFTPENEPSQFFCEAHAAEADVLFIAHS